MSAGWAGVGGRIAGAGALLAAAASFAADSAPSATPLENAKRDYAEIKKPGVRTEADLGISKDNLPPISVGVPDALSLQPPRAPTRREAEKLKAQREKSANWLLEAMRQPASSKARLKTDRDAPPALGATDAADEETAARLQSELLDGGRVTARENPAARSAKPENEEKSAPVNPLDAFMASWMTPRDFELLASAAKTSSPAAPNAPREVSGFAPTPAADAPGFFAKVYSPAPGFASEMQREPLPNPYLAPLESSLAGFAPPPVSSPANPPPAPPSLAVPGPAPTARGEGPAPTQTPSPGEWLRGSEDAKYFKQLKRF